MMNEEFQVYFPGKLVFGKGCLGRLSGELLQPGINTILLVTIGPLLPALGNFIAELEAGGLNVAVETGIHREPTFSDLSVLIEKAEAIAPDAVLGIGGGSVLDAAKLVAAQLRSDQSLHDIVGIGLLNGRSTKLVCVPATSGTGSEASPNAILVDDSDNQKKGIISPFLVPDVVYVDPLLTLSVPKEITAATGLDALTHCMEAYTNKFSRAFIDMYAYEGMRLISENLATAVANGSDEDARTEVAMGSLLGGFCLGPVNTAGVHALSYPLGSMFHLPHGLSNAVLLPHVMEFNIPASPKKYAEVAIALGCAPGADVVQTAFKGVERVRELIAECGIISRLSELGVSKEDFHQMADDAMKITRLLKNNPRPITHEDAVSIYDAAY